MNDYDCKIQEKCSEKIATMKKLEITDTVWNERTLGATNLVEKLTGNVFEAQLSHDGELCWPSFGMDDCPFGQQIIDFDAGTDCNLPSWFLLSVTQHWHFCSCILMVRKPCGLALLLHSLTMLVEQKIDCTQLKKVDLEKSLNVHVFDPQKAYKMIEV